MKTEYKRDLKNNYLVIDAEGLPDTEDYIFHMAAHNEIPGLIPFQVRKMNGKSSLYYEITSKKSLAEAYEKRMVGFDDILRIVSEIQEISEMIRRYLLNPGRLLLNPEYMYMDIQSGKLELCYLPAADPDAQIVRLAEYLLKKLDHKDSRAVALGYQFYQKATEPNFSIPELLHDTLNTVWMKETVSSEPESRTEEHTEIQEEYILQEPLTGKKEKKEREKRKIPAETILLSIIGGIAAVLLVISRYFGWMDLTQTGGCFFLITAVLVLISRICRSRRKNKAKSGKGEWAEETESERYTELKQTMYQRKDSSDTTFLSDYDPLEKLILVSSEPGKYPDILPGDRILVVGKMKGQADILLRAPAVSRIHARIESIQGRCYIQDLGSRNGTFLNGTRLDKSQREQIREGDQVEFADIVYQVKRQMPETDETQLLY